MAKGIANEDLWGTFINYLFSSKSAVFVPKDFHERCNSIKNMLDDDVSGIVSTLLDYSVNSASEAQFKVECSDETLERLLAIWLNKININIEGIPTGIQALSREYYNEIWQGSSFVLLKLSNWKDISYEGNTITVPTTLWFYNGASIYVDRKNKKNFKLGSDNYFSDESLKNSIKKENEQIIVQKYGSRWFSEYPSPYCIRKGILKNYLGIEILKSKGDEAITKALPYLLKLTKGDNNRKCSPDQLTELSNIFKTALKRYNAEKGEIPLSTTPDDEKFEHIIPELLPIVKEELFRQGYRALLGGLGFIDLLEITPSRQETRLNPKPFIAEVNAGVEGFKSILKEVIYLIINENKELHRKFFSDNKSLKIVSSPLRINIDQILDQIRSGFVYGAVTIETYQEALNIDPDKELERAKKEWDDGLRDIYYPHLIQNREDIPDPNNISVPKTKKQIEKQKEKEKASEQLIVKCKKCGNEFDYLSVSEAGMGWVKCPKCEEAVTQEDLIIAPYNSIEQLLQKHPNMKKYPKVALKVFIEVFNSIYNETHDEARAFSGAWSKLYKWMRRHGNKWTKSEEGLNNQMIESINNEKLEKEI